MRLSIHDVCSIGIFVAIIAVCAQIAIPTGGVPFTLQVWAIALAGLILGPKRGTIAASIYVALGAIGIPVFAGFTSGIGIILGMTGGFIFSFPILAFFSGIGGKKDNILWAMGGITVGTVINFACGMLYFSWFTSLSLTVSFGAAVTPFILPAVVKIIILPVISKNIKLSLRKARVAV